MTQDIRTALAGLLAAHVAICRDAGIDPTINAQYREARALLATPAPLSDEPVARLETTSENIARDIREGRFPKRSEPQMIANPSDKQEARKHVETQPGSPNFDGAEAYEAYLNAQSAEQDRIDAGALIEACTAYNAEIRRLKRYPLAVPDAMRKALQAVTRERAND